MFTIREAREADVPIVGQLIRELAEYERLSHAVEATLDDLRDTLFGPRRFAEALIAELGNEPIGFALFFHNYSTFRGRPGLYVEDVFVREAHRAKGVGKALFRRMAQLALDRGCARMEWAVLDWNEPAINFYRKMGATPMGEWTTQRLTGEALARLARES
jgi:GNAT superfamily N-acetyltransferase